MTTPSQPDLTRPIEVSFERRVDPGYYTHYSLYPQLSNSEFSDLMSESNREHYRRLFEAAPDPLKALEAIMEVGNSDNVEYRTIVRNLAQSAINKAKGV